MLTRSSVLGKRGHNTSSSASTATQACEYPTPDATPSSKRARTSTVVEDGDGNKENIPPFRSASVSAPPTPRSTRAMRRGPTATDIASPTRTRTVPHRTASVSTITHATPSKEDSGMTVLTPPPSPPNALLPLHVRVRAVLRSTCNNEIDIAGRKAERESIMEFITPFVNGTACSEEDAPSGLFISGTPGTGKTALVNTIIRDVLASQSTNLKVISINCMALDNVEALWAKMIEELRECNHKASNVKKLKGRELVKHMLTSLEIKCMLILDELDHIASTPQTLASIFTLTENLPKALRLVAIANTHTLTSTMSSSAIDASYVQTIHFSPYTPAQLQHILQARLDALCNDNPSAETTADIKKLLPPPALMLLTKKIASLTGDVRSLFEVLRGAIDLAVSSNVTTEDNILSACLPSITPKHILAALKAYTPSTSSLNSVAPALPSTVPGNQSNSETVVKVQNLGLQARLALLTALLASKRLEAGLPLSTSAISSPKKSPPSPIKRSSSLPNTNASKPAVGIDTTALHGYYSAVLGRAEAGLFEPVSRSEFGDLLGILEGVGIVVLASSLRASGSPSGKGRKPFGRSASFASGLNKNCAGAVGEVRLVDSMWGDEILRGLGITGTSLSSDTREEEVRGIWSREQTRLKRDIKAAISADSAIDAFNGASQD